MQTYTLRYPGPIITWTPGGEQFAAGPVDERLRHSADRPDIVILRAILPEHVGLLTTQIPPKHLERIARGDAVLVLDSSTEGAEFTSAMASKIHKTLREIGVPPAQTVFITQNRQWLHLYRAFCQAMQVEPIHVLDYDYYIRNFFRDAEASGAADYAQRLAAFENRGASRERRFVCLNRSARLSKILLLLKLIEGGQFDHGFITFPGFDKTSGPRALKRSETKLQLLAVPGMEDIGADLSPLVDDLARRQTPMLGEPAEVHDRDEPLAEYSRSWFTIVTETECWATRRITEKALKPLANFSPFILWGNPGSLALIRDLGFRTFGDVIDESYDEELDRRRRFAMVYGEIARLCALPEAELARIEAQLAETLAFNAHHALVTMPREYRLVREPQLVDGLLDLRASRAA